VAAAQPVSPLIANWDQFFTVQSESEGGGRSLSTISNTSGYGASRIQLLVEALDAGGQPVSQRVVWLGTDLPAGTRTYFETPVPAAASYRVRVFAFDLDLTSGPR
jgi:hypothetical protein